MKRFLLATMATCVCLFSFGQSNVGIGTSSPNPNAALHVDAAGGLKGIMIPRLTSAQRTVMAMGLGSADKGLLVLDGSVNQIFLWTGTAWKSLSDLSYPINDTNRVALAGTPLIRLVNDYAGNDGGFIAQFINRNADHMGAPLSALTNSTKFPSAAFYAEHAGTGDVALSARITNASNTNPALFGESAGSGAAVMGIKRAGQAGVPIMGRNDGTGEGAGTFRVTDNTNIWSALFAETNGTGSGVLGIAHGTGSSTRGLKLANGNGAALVGEHRGPSGNAGLFQITNADNSSAAVRAETNGAGPAIDAFASGAAPAINVIKPEGSSGQGIYIDHQGTSGPVAQFRRTNPNAVGVTIIGSNNSVNSPSLAVYALHEGTGDAAFVARINNAQNAFAASYAETNGSGSALFANQLGTGRAAQIQINNVANSQIALRAFTNGTGKAARISTANPGNSDTATMVETNGSGPAFAAVQTGSGIGGVFTNTSTNAGVALRVINNSTQNGTYALEVIQNGSGTATDALFVAKNSGTGSAGNFVNNNAGNDASNLYTATNAPNGIAMGAMNTANGFAYAAWGGGIRVTSHTVASGTTIATRATAYLINGGGPYTFGFSLANGEMMMIFNNTASAVTVGGVSIPANSGKTCVVLEGVLRPM